MKDTNFQGVLFLQQLLDTIPNAVYFKDTFGMYRGCNHAFEDLTGWSKEDVLGKTDYEIMPRTLADKCYQMDATLMNSHVYGTVQEFETEIRTKQGEMHKASFHKSVYKEKNGKVAGIIGIILDVTKMQKAEAAKVTELIRASVAERISIISTIVSSGVGEMNSAISAIQQISDSFTFWHDNGKEVSFDQVMLQVKKIDENLKRIKKVSKNLLNFVKKRQKEEIEPINLNQVAIGAAEILNSEFKKHGITVKSELAGNVPMVSANFGRMEEIVINILVFAMRSFQKPEVKKRQIIIGSKCNMSETKIEIFYTGARMSRGELDAVFDPVFADAESDDMSITMAIGKTIVEEYKGKITIDNVENEGILCTISFST